MQVNCTMGLYCALSKKNSYYDNYITVKEDLVFTHWSSQRLKGCAHVAKSDEFVVVYFSKHTPPLLSGSHFPREALLHLHSQMTLRKTAKQNGGRHSTPFTRAAVLLYVFLIQGLSNICMTMIHGCCCRGTLSKNSAIKNSLMHMKKKF